MLTGLALFLFLPAAQAQDKPLTLDAIVNGIAQAPLKIKSAHIKFTMVTEKDPDWELFHKDSHDQPHSLNETTQVEWAFKGDKWYNKSAAPDDTQLQNPEQRSRAKYRPVNSVIYDGKDNHSLEAGISAQGNPHLADYVSQATTPFWTPMDLGYYCYGEHNVSHWIIDKLKQGHYTLDGTETDKKFGLLYILTWKNDQDETERFWIAPKFDFMAVRRDQISSKFRDGNRGMSKFICLSAQQVDGIWVPVEGVKETYHGSGSNEQHIITRRYKDAHYELNNVPDSLFEVHLPPGAWYIDQNKPGMYRIGASGEKILDERSIVKTSELPFRWLFIASIATLMALGAGAVVRWQRKRVSI